MILFAPTCAERTTATYSPARIASLMARRAYMAAAATSGNLVPDVAGSALPVSATIRGMDALRAIDSWGAGVAVAGVARAEGGVETYGPDDVELPWASVTKIVAGLALLVALEEGTV